MRIGIRLVLFATLVATLPACGAGLIYTHKTVPLDVNYRSTETTERTAKSDTRHFRYYIQVDWNSNAIGEIAREHGFEEVRYADLETLSVLGVWTQRWVHVYGN